MTLEEEVTPRGWNVRLVGRFDATQLPPVYGLAARLMNSGATRLVLDMQEVTYLDSAAVAVLMEIFAGMVGRGGDMALLNPSLPVQAALERAMVWDAIACVSRK